MVSTTRQVPNPHKASHKAADTAIATRGDAKRGRGVEAQVMS
jgi:hypothetical protein